MGNRTDDLDDIVFQLDNQGNIYGSKNPNLRNAPPQNNNAAIPNHPVQHNPHQQRMDDSTEQKKYPFEINNEDEMA